MGKSYGIKKIFYYFYFCQARWSILPCGPTHTPSALRNKKKDRWDLVPSILHVINVLVLGMDMSGLICPSTQGGQSH